MREIKFRAWDKKIKMWIENFYIDSDGTIRATQYSHLGEPHLDISDKIEVVQYTGLKDKNEKEIYEGDILKQKGGHKREVVFNYGVFWAWSKGGGQLELYIFLKDVEEIEVIGNIYENPELPKQKNQQ